jgi:hypothetical protein
VAFPSGHTIVIPATQPTKIPDWLLVSQQSEHWKCGVWVTETIEVYTK